MRSKFKDEHPFGEFLAVIHLIYLTFICGKEKRKAEAERIRQKYPDRIPVRKVLSLLVICINPPFSGHLREGRSHRHPHNRQEEVSCPLCLSLYPLPVTFHVDMWCYHPGPDCGTVCLCDSEANQTCAREGYLHIRRRGSTPNSRFNECYLRRAQVRPLPSNTCCKYSSPFCQQG